MKTFLNLYRMYRGFGHSRIGAARVAFKILKKSF